jgi:alkylation response protein AidB-like acyl-CoA dehydrogenase
MFIMMNAARFSVGLQGVAIAERAFQRALAYAKERLQGRDLAGGGGTVPIIRHPDVRRMLMLIARWRTRPPRRWTLPRRRKARCTRRSST